MRRRGSNQGGSKKKVANGLVAMSSAAVLAVYSAGYVRTRTAADRLSAHAMERRMEREAAPEEIAPPAPVPVVAKHLVPHANPVKHKVSIVPKAVAAPAIPDAPAPAAIAEVAPPVEAAPAPVPVAASVADSPEPAPAPPPKLAPPVFRDGKYQGWGSCRHGDIQATVVVEAGKIVSAQISDCETRYPCDLIGILPGQVVTRQSANVRRIAGATESSDAFYWAVVEALKQAK